MDSILPRIALAFLYRQPPKATRSMNSCRSLPFLLTAAVAWQGILLQWLAAEEGAKEESNGLKLTATLVNPEKNIISVVWKKPATRGT